MQLQGFLQKLSQLNRANVAGKGKAPHKPVFLLALADWFEENPTTSHTIPFDEKLITCFRENWELLVSQETYTGMLIVQPFFFLKSEGFWQPVFGNGQHMYTQVKSIKRLYETHAGGRLSDDAFRCYQNPVDRELIRMKLLDAYFPETKRRYIEAKGMDGLILDIEADVLKEPSYTPRYGRTVKGMKEREGYIRDQKFADNLLYHYQYTCCITGLWVADATMVDACHIKPHALCGINSLDNGLALCPNLHHAFDGGMFSLTDDYHVIVSEKLVEADTAYSLKKLDGRKIRLPKKEKYWPGREWVRWQRESKIKLGST